MLTLGIETSARLASVALAEGRELLAESLLPVRATHSEKVLPEVERLLAACGRAPAEVEAVVVGAGPGSFTGVRIGASLAKGLCFAGGRPLYAYPSLAAIAAGSGVPGPVGALVDARRGEVYYAAYRFGSEFEERVAPGAAPIEAALAALAGAAGGVFAGAGAVTHAAEIARLGGRVLPPHLGVARAAALLWLADTFPEAGRVRDVDGWEPRYVRPPGAERGPVGDRETGEGDRGE